MKKTGQLRFIFLMLFIAGIFFIACSDDGNISPEPTEEQREEPKEEEPKEEEPKEEEPKEEEPVEEEPKEEEAEPIILNVMSFGIYNKNADLNQVAELIKEYNPDLVVLREVDRNNTRTGVDIDQGKEVADLTGMNYYFASGWSYREGEYGPSILSRFPITDSESRVLSVGPELGGQTRPFAWVTVQVEEGFELVFASAHLDDGSNANRRAENLPIQAQEIIDIFTGEDRPVIMGGNFYFETPEDAHLGILYNMFTPACTNCDLTYPADNLGFVADHIMYKATDNTEMEVVSYTAGNEVLNNRKPVLAEIKISRK